MVESHRGHSMCSALFSRYRIDGTLLNFMLTFSGWAQPANTCRSWAGTGLGAKPWTACHMLATPLPWIQVKSSTTHTHTQLHLPPAFVVHQSHLITQSNICSGHGSRPASPGPFQRVQTNNGSIASAASLQYGSMLMLQFSGILPLMQTQITVRHASGCSTPASHWKPACSTRNLQFGHMRCCSQLVYLVTVCNMHPMNLTATAWPGPAWSPACTLHAQQLSSGRRLSLPTGSWRDV